MTGMTVRDRAFVAMVVFTAASIAMRGDRVMMLVFLIGWFALWLIVSIWGDDS